MPKKILVCVNGSAHARRALHIAAAQAQRESWKLELLYVVDTRDLQHFFSMADHMLHEKRDEAQQIIQTYVAELSATMGLCAGVHMIEGAIGDVILSIAARDPDIAMVVLGVSPESPSRGDLFPWLIQQLGKNLHVPLLFVPKHKTHE